MMEECSLEKNEVITGGLQWGTEGASERTLELRVREKDCVFLPLLWNNKEEMGKLLIIN
jgi:hypothetical protein